MEEDGRKVISSSQELQTAGKAAETQNINHSDTTSQQAGNDKPLEHNERESCKWVVAKANSLNEVNNCDFVACPRISLDAESGPAANRRRRKRYSPCRNNAQKVSVN